MVVLEDLAPSTTLFSTGKFGSPDGERLVAMAAAIWHNTHISGTLQTIPYRDDH